MEALILPQNLYNSIDSLENLSFFENDYKKRYKIKNKKELIKLIMQKIKKKDVNNLPRELSSIVDQLKNDIKKKKKIKKKKGKKRKLITKKKFIKKEKTLGTGSDPDESYPVGSGGMNPEADVTPNEVPEISKTSMNDEEINEILENEENEGINNQDENGEIQEESQEDNWKLGKKFGKWLKKSIKKIGTLFGSTVLLPLLPLKGTMIKALRKSGDTVTNKRTALLTVAERFYNNVVRKHNKGSHYEEIHFDDYNEDNILPAVGAVVSGIITFIKNLKQKKAEGGKMSKTEKIIVGNTEKVEKIIKQKAKDQAAEEVGKKILFSKNTQVMIVIVIIIIIIVSIYIIKKSK